MRAPDPALERMAERAGVLTRYVDGLGVARRALPTVVRALCDAVGSIDEPAPGVVSVATAGCRALHLAGRGWRERGRGRLVLEGGGELNVRLSRRGRAGAIVARLDAPVPLGVHELVLDGEGPGPRRFVLARPRSLSHLVARDDRRLAVFMPLYSVTPGGVNGIGTYADLREMCEWADRSAGALVGTLPLFPAFLDRPFDPSPYAPVSRLMWNELFVDPCAAPEWRAPAVRRARASPAARRVAALVRTGPLVDYRGSWDLARRTLKAMAAVAQSSSRRWAEVISRSSAETVRYAQFRAAVDATGRTWQRWPASWRAGRIDPSGVDAADVRMYVYAQALAGAQIAAVRGATGSGSPLYLDLTVGVHAGGFDTYTRPDLFLHAFSAGAPPDQLNAKGQVWGFPPMHPLAGRADGYAHLRAVLRRMLGVAGVLRIDHVMGLYRMYCVPSGLDGTEGAYVRYPEEELFAVVMIEAARAGAVVVGEDLGTVPPPVRRIMKRCGILGMHVQQFAVGGEGARAVQPAGAGTLASLNTHDTPTFAGFWHADDVALRRSLGHTDSAGAARERVDRAGVRRSIAGALKREKLAGGSATIAGVSLMRSQARGPAPISLVNLEDLWGERRPQNVPGTLAEYPNWRRRSARSLRNIARDRGIAGVLAQLRRDRRRTVGEKNHR